MEISIKTEELKKYSIFVATPMFGGNCTGMYMKACLDLQSLCMQYGIDLKFSFLFNESLIPRARNYLVDEFINRSTCTHFLFIDADVCFDPKDVIAMLALDKDVIGGPYPKKAIKWASVKAAVLKNPDINPQELEKIVGDFVFNPVQGTQQFNVTEPIEVMELGTGYMMINRDVFSKLKDAFPQLEYRPDHVGQNNFDGTRMIHAYFDTGIDTKDSITGGGSMRFLSEDYQFTNLFRKIGGKIWMCPWMKTTHIGTYHFSGNLPAIANHVGTI